MPSEIILVLTLGVILLGFGSLSLLLVRLTSPGLQGVGWCSASFAAGALGAGLQMLRGVPILSVLLTDISLLACFFLLHMGALEVIESRMTPLWHGLLLVSVQAALDVLVLRGVVGQRLRLASLAWCIAAQGINTVVALWPSLRTHLRIPAAFCITILLGFTLANLFRGAVLFLQVGSLGLRQQIGFVVYSLFLVATLGLAFGYLWMSTTALTAEMEHTASTDPLTRVYNRRVFLKWCEKELLRSQRSNVPFSLLMLDLDHFKSINDNFGHQRGDEVLCAAVERMQDSVRGIDVLCRWGGEEFAVLLPNAPVEATRIVAERIRENIQRMGVALAEPSEKEAFRRHLTVSIGAATYRDLDDDIAAMLLRADRALYRAKNGGRNKVLIGA